MQGMFRTHFSKTRKIGSGSVWNYPLTSCIEEFNLFQEVAASHSTMLPAELANKDAQELIGITMVHQC